MVFPIQAFAAPRAPRRLEFTRHLAAAVLLLLVAGPAAAHPVPFSYVDLRLGSTAVEGIIVVHMFDAAHDLTVDPPERLLDA